MGRKRAYLSFSKVFDTSHSFLRQVYRLDKLTVKLIKNQLNDRAQRVCVEVLVVFPRLYSRGQANTVQCFDLSGGAECALGRFTDNAKWRGIAETPCVLPSTVT